MTNKIKASNLDTNAVTADAISYPLTTFSSTGIDDNATSTAITIDSSQNVGIGTTSPNTLLHLKANNAEILFEDSNPDDTREAKINTNAGDLIFQVGDDLTGTPTVDGQLTMFDGGSLIYSQSGTNRFNINSSGNVGIGDTGSSTIKLSVTGNGGSNTTTMLISQDIDSLTTIAEPLIVQNRVTGTGSGVGTGVAIRFNGERNDGNAQVFGRVGFDAQVNSGTSLQTDFFVRRYLGTEIFRVTYGGRLVRDTTSTASAHGNFVGEVGSSSRALAFEHTNGGGVVGSVTTGASSTSYNTSSDYRLKENVVDLTNATERLKQLQPKRFNFITDADTTVDGFLAHEVSDIVPEAITGTKDAVQVWEEGDELPEGVSVGDNKLDENGNTIPDYQGIDQSKLVPLLVKTIQESITKIETLETENTSMKARLDALENT